MAGGLSPGGGDAGLDVIVDIQAITYRGRTVAACTRRRFFLSDDIADRDPNDPLVSFVIGMCLYAHLVAAGDMPGPYTDDDARAYARDCLIPDELLDRADLDVESVAAWLRVPADELRLARRERNLRRMGRVGDAAGRRLARRARQR